MADEAISAQVSRSSFVSSNIHLVPVFCESSVESFFSVFESIATALQWPEDVWGVMLLCKFTGKAQEACSGLSRQDSLVYEKIKSAVLQAYELVPEAYRQNFRGLELAQGQSYLDFAREKAKLFGRWCSASQVHNFGSLRELMLVEDFKNSVPKCIALYLSEQRVSTLQQAAILADEFTLTHKTNAVECDIPSHYNTSWRARREPANEAEKVVVSSSKAKLCFFCHKPGHVVADCVKLALKRKAYRKGRRPDLKTVTHGSQTNKVVRPSKGPHLGHSCLRGSCGQCKGSINSERPLVDNFLGPQNDLQGDRLCIKPPVRPATLANKHACTGDLRNRLQSVAERSSDCLCSPHVMAQKSPSHHMRHCFEGLGPPSVSILNPLRWGWQLPLTMPNRCYGVW
ncbi:uncharacterized protein LOC113015392 [Astatotilapia calliptera]|uniref:uncharacterized protein LOC113015392 n=1 Tax=Astatotilapia calliptera TaxID=8154 RepID=UPI000E40EC99|nr:uncharacterized protein LOC113015392 [Astatotilapia calliptera]XP_026013196.1 uncharacterized protein LOC113015392 [Astatotilapia calliptera]XP_026013197.1 uncharacterized protein LOC113015392 [Astatotilapia calliptera]